MYENQTAVQNAPKEPSQFENILKSYDSQLDRYSNLVERIYSRANNLKLTPVNDKQKDNSLPKMAREIGIVNSFEDKLDRLRECNCTLDFLVNHFEGII